MMKIEVIKDFRPYIIVMTDEDGKLDDDLYSIGPFAHKSDALMYAVKHIDHYKLVALNDPDDGVPVTYLYTGENNGNTTVRTDGTSTVSVSIQSTSN